MRYLILFMLAAGLFVFGSRSCGNGWNLGFGGIRGEGPAKTESRSVRDFHAIEAQIPGVIEVRISDEYLVEVQAQENLLKVIKTEVKNGRLRIYSDENIWSAEDLVIRVSAPSFDALALAGSGNLNVYSTLNGEKLKLSIAGSGEIDLPKASVDRLSCEIAGSGDIVVSGRAAEASCHIAGSGDIHAEKLITDQFDAEIAGSGTIKCQVMQRLKASIAGSGDIYYTGSPQVDTDISGSGSVKRSEEQ
jgi:hypothetical protein